MLINLAPSSRKNPEMAEQAAVAAVHFTFFKHNFSSSPLGYMIFRMLQMVGVLSQGYCYGRVLFLFIFARHPSDRVVLCSPLPSSFALHHR